MDISAGSAKLLTEASVGVGPSDAKDKGIITVLTYVNFPIYNPFTKRIYKKRLDLHADIYNNLHLVN